MTLICVFHPSILVPAMWNGTMKLLGTAQTTIWSVIDLPTIV